MATTSPLGIFGGYVSDNSRKQPTASGLDTQERAITQAKNKAQGTNMTADEQRAFHLWKKQNGGGTPKEFMNLPKQERQQYLDTVKDMGSAPSNGAALASAAGPAADTFSRSEEGRRENREGSSDIGGLLGALGASFAA